MTKGWLAKMERPTNFRSTPESLWRRRRAVQSESPRRPPLLAPYVMWQRPLDWTPASSTSWLRWRSAVGRSGCLNQPTFRCTGSFSGREKPKNNILRKRDFTSSSRSATTMAPSATCTCPPWGTSRSPSDWLLGASSHPSRKTLRTSATFRSSVRTASWITSAFVFRRIKIYTYAGSILIAINPFKFLPIYNPKYVKMYENHQLGKLQPHIFAIADVAYYAMLRKHINQCIVISGESGSGKTQSTNFLIHCLTALSQKGYASGVERTSWVLDLCWR